MERNYQKEFGRLFDIIKELRQKCPWDKKQTTHSLATNTIEELYELIDSIRDNNWAGIREELGDMMLHLLFYAMLAEEQKQFTLWDVLHQICEKLIYRHPHVYGEAKMNNENEVMTNWEKLKLKEGKKSALAGVPISLPSMIKAMRMQEKAARLGFDFPNKEEAFKKVQEEEKELQDAIQTGKQEHMEEEMGDLFFSWINYARFMNINVENALENTNKKFKSRFEHMEALAQKKNWNIQALSLEQWELLYQMAKKELS